MEFFLTLTFLFAVGALCGWVIELFFRRLNSKKWINPGFLHGPYLPLYGFGLVFCFCCPYTARRNFSCMASLCGDIGGHLCGNDAHPNTWRA